MFRVKELPGEEDFRALAPAYSSLDAPSVMLFYPFSAGRRRHAHRVRGDRRKVIARLTPKGREGLNAIFPGYYSRVSALMNDLTDEEREELSALLHNVKNRARSLKQALRARR